MSDREMYCERDVILSDAQIEEIIRNTAKETSINYKHTPLSKFDKNKLPLPYNPKPITMTVEAQEILHHLGFKKKKTSILEKVLDYLKKKLL